MFTLLLVIFIIDIVLIIPVILLQSGSGAQSGVFGSDMAMGAFGAKTSEVLVRFTKWLVGIFFVLAFLLGYLKVQEYKGLVRDRQQQVNQNQNQNNGQQPVQGQDTNNTAFNTNTMATNIPLQR